MSKNILIADDHGIVRIGLSTMIKKIRPDCVLLEATDYAEVIKTVKKQQIDLLIIDLSMPNGNFRNTFDIIKQQQPKAKILIYSSMDQSIYAMRYIQLGVDGFLDKLAGETEIKNALEKIFTNGKYLSESVKDALVFNAQKNKNTATDPITLLSSRELSVAHMLIKGDSLKHIAQELNIHISTVSTYKNRLFDKLKITSLPDLIKVLDTH